MVRRHSLSNFIVLLSVGLAIALIGGVTVYASQLVNNTVVDQFRSQELQLVSSLSRETETKFDSLVADIKALSLESVLTAPDSFRAPDEDMSERWLDTRELMGDYAEANGDIVQSVVRFDLNGEPEVAYPDDLNDLIASGERLPFGLPSYMTTLTRDGGIVPFDIRLLSASHRDKPEGTNLLVAPVLLRSGKTEFLVYEVNLTALFADVMDRVLLDGSDQLWTCHGNYGAYEKSGRYCQK